MRTDAEYFRRRAREERQAALLSERISVRLRHLEFAQAYDLRFREMEAEERRSAVRLVDAA